MSEEIAALPAETDTKTDTAAAATDGQSPEKEVSSEASESSEEALDDAPDGDTENELKTIRKALDKRNRYINNLRERIRTLEAEREKVRSSGVKNTEAPRPEAYESVLDYVRADNAHTLESRLAEQERSLKIAELERQQNQALELQAQAVGARVQELQKSSPDFAKTIQESAGVIGSMPTHIERIMAEIDDAPAATYALAKEGRLEALYTMPASIAAAHIVQAELRGQQYLLQAAKPRKTAPEPIGAIKGGKSSTPSLSDMSPSELDKWRKS